MKFSLGLDLLTSSGYELEGSNGMPRCAWFSGLVSVQMWSWDLLFFLLPNRKDHYPLSRLQHAR